MTWTIWYDSGETITVDAAGWPAAPDEGVQIVVRDRTCVYYGRDYYLLRGTTAMAFDADGLPGQLREGIPRGAIKFGRWIEDERWRAIWNRAFPDQPR